MTKLIRLTVVILLVISVISSLSKPPAEVYSKNLGHPWEEYDPSYYKKFRTIESVIDYANSSSEAGEKNSLQYYNLVAEIIRKRFYHGYSYYHFSDNPLCYLAGISVWSHLSAIVIPDDIMKHPMAACSQQSIVLMEIFKRNKIDYRKIAFNGHFALEGFIEGHWRFFDTDMEPRLATDRVSVNDLQSEKKLYQAYANTGLGYGYLQGVLGKPHPGNVNEKVAIRAEIFHRICFLLVSKWFLVAALVLSFFSDIRLSVLRRFFARHAETVVYTPMQTSSVN